MVDLNRSPPRGVTTMQIQATQPALAWPTALAHEEANQATGSPPGESTNQVEQEAAALRRRDGEVRAHESAHMAAGGSLVRGGASFTYEVGPDGRTYAVGGEVSIDTSSVPGDPAATMRKMQQVRAAALAPASPSGQDRAVGRIGDGRHGRGGAGTRPGSLRVGGGAGW